MCIRDSKKGVLPGPFCEALIRAHPATFAEVRRLAVAHIADESEVAEKRGSVAPTRPRAQTRIHPQRVLETAPTRRDQRTRHPYDPRKNKGRGKVARNQHAGSTIARLSTSLSWDWRT